MNDTAQRKAAIEFVNLWKGKGDEKQETQQFWSDLLHRVFGITNFSSRVQFEKRVPLLHTSFIDVFIPETKVIVEQKSMDIDLYKRKKQSDGTELNPYEQAQRYGSKLPYSERPRWIVTCNFQKFVIYDMDEVRPEEHPVEILLEELPDKYHLLSFLIDPTVKKITVEQQLSFKAGELVGKLYDLMLPLYKDPTADSTLQSLNKFCVRIVFCLYAEDAMLFGPKGSEFHDYLASFLPENRRKALIALFRILDTPEADRDPYEEQKLLDFPYVNGGLFSGDIEIPKITDEITKLILEDMSENLDWSRISPTIFGAVFESTLNPETRRSGGMHYTSIKDIHKVIDPLFLDDLQTELDNILHDPKLSNPKRQVALETFHNKLSKLHFLDPACGSGNFLTETFLSLRRMENRLIEYQLKGQTVLEFANPVKVSIGQFAGIEINDFAVTVARTALWIAESQMIKETEAIVNQTIEFFPLKTDAKIVEGNALRMDWNDVCSKHILTYIMGNPPFIGYSLQNREQKADMLFVYKDASGKSYKKAGKIDYVNAWYFKAAELIQGTNIKVAFVSTNSITQGEQVADAWKPLYENFKIHIDFAYKTFKWGNEATDQAAVHVVIIGFSTTIDNSNKKLYSENDVEKVDKINPYLMNANIVFVEGRSNALCNVPDITKGFQATDNGYLILNEQEKNELLQKEPSAEKWIRPYSMGLEFIRKIPRYCLWLVNITPTELQKLPMIKQRIIACKEWRNSATKTGDAYKLRDIPHLFRPCKQFKDVPYIAIPLVSSENRRYVPMGFIDNGMIPGNNLFGVFNASLYHFGILTSNVHMAWMRAIGGRLEMRYRYSINIVYNNFPWPAPTDQQKEKIEKTAQAILDARANYPDSSLADLYDETLMPADLRKAHKANDRAVMEAYGMWGEVESESECVAWLFRMYEELTKAEGK